ncbi:MAG: J domain-containing protein [Clostridiales bacterium]|jgi:molecular chaperone DnaJ|nr:J domain-containing protein [Clostridiales bacterium]
MSVNDPYKILGVNPNATDDEVKTAYREMARKYHPDNYSNNPLSELAQEKMQEVNEAYDTIVNMRKGRGSGSGGYGGGSASSRYADVRNMINSGRIQDAEMLIDGVPAGSRDAEWYFLKGSILYKKGWLEDAYQNFATACRMDPGNAEYQAAMSQMNSQRQTGGYRTTGAPAGGGCSACDVCNALICTDCCCECMGGDFIRCC